MSTISRQFSARGSPDFRTGGGAAGALKLMAQALALLDASDAPADAGAYLDHAMHRIRDWAAKVELKEPEFPSEPF